MIINHNLTSVHTTPLGNKPSESFVSVGLALKTQWGKLNGLKIGWGCQNSDGVGLKILDLLITFILPKVQCAMTVGHCQMQLGVGGALSPSVGPAQSLRGGLGAKPRSSDDLSFYSTKRNRKKHSHGVILLHWTERILFHLSQSY